MFDVIAFLVQEYRDFSACPGPDDLARKLAAKAGLGWVGKHSLLLNESAGSFFFLGELLVSLPLPLDAPVDCRICNS